MPNGRGDSTATEFDGYIDLGKQLSLLDALLAESIPKLGCNPGTGVGGVLEANDAATAERLVSVLERVRAMPTGMASAIGGCHNGENGTGGSSPGPGGGTALGPPPPSHVMRQHSAPNDKLHMNIFRSDRTIKTFRNHEICHYVLIRKVILIF